MRNFYKKWKDITGCADPEKLQSAIYENTGFSPT